MDPPRAEHRPGAAPGRSPPREIRGLAAGRLRPHPRPLTCLRDGARTAPRAATVTVAGREEWQEKRGVATPRCLSGSIATPPPHGHWLAGTLIPSPQLRGKERRLVAEENCLQPPPVGRGLRGAARRLSPRMHSAGSEAGRCEGGRRRSPARPSATVNATARTGPAAQAEGRRREFAPSAGGREGQRCPGAGGRERRWRWALR